MNKRLFTSLAALALAGAVAAATTVAGVTVPETATVAGQQLVLNGAGLRVYIFFKVYVGALYLPSKTSDAGAALGQNGAARVSMQFLRDVSAGRLAGAWEEGFEGNTAAAELSKLKPQVERFTALFPDVAEKDLVEIDVVPGTGTSVTIDGKLRGTIEGDDFGKAVLRIWLGPKPPTKDLQRGMLGKP